MQLGHQPAHCAGGAACRAKVPTLGSVCLPPWAQPPALIHDKYKSHDKGDTYYYNTWSEEVAWVQPLEMTLLPHLSQPPPEAWEEAFDDEKGCPVWISSATGEKTYSRPPELDYE